MGVEDSCRVLCRKELSGEEAGLFAARIEEDYRVTDMIVDNLPAATRVVEPATPTTPSRVITIYERGFPLGFKGSSEMAGRPDHPTIRPSGHPTIRPSDHPAIRPSDHPTIRPSDHPTIWPSDHAFRRRGAGTQPGP